MIRNAIAILVLATIGLGAQGCPLPPTVPDAGHGDSGTTTTADASTPDLPTWDASKPCESAYARMASLACEPLAPTTGSWVTACRNARENGQTFGVPCIRKVASLADVRSCGVSCVH